MQVFVCWFIFVLFAIFLAQATVSEKDLLEREYEFSSEKQRNEFVLGILKLGLDVQRRARNNPLPHFFVIHKTGSVGQAQVLDFVVFWFLFRLSFVSGSNLAFDDRFNLES